MRLSAAALPAASVRRSSSRSRRRRQSRRPARLCIAGGESDAGALSSPAPLASPGEEGWDPSDSMDAPPLPLPSVLSAVRVTMVRHGQSTWNAEGRVQGSSDESVLTAMGEAQAETTATLLHHSEFDKLFHSPLKRAARTADIIWKDRPGFVECLSTLREIDLYDMEGFVKSELSGVVGEAYQTWKVSPSSFCVSERYPVRELWYRASLAWQSILMSNDEAERPLVVAHNAVNQALLCVSLDLPPSYFRRFIQSNGGISCLDFVPGRPYPVIDRLNQSPDSPLSSQLKCPRIILVRAGATEFSENGLLMGLMDEPLSQLGAKQAVAISTLLIQCPIAEIYHSPMARSWATAELANMEQDTSIMSDESLINMSLGDWEGKPASNVRTSPKEEKIDNLQREEWQRVWERVEGSCSRWVDAAKSAYKENRGAIVLVTHSPVISAIVAQALGADPDFISRLRFDTGSVSVIDIIEGDNAEANSDADGGGQVDASSTGFGVLRCLNYTTHLKEWAVAVTPSDELEICGIEGCF